MTEQLSEILLRRKEVEAFTGLGRSSIYKQMSKGLFPKPVKLSDRAVGWPKSKIDAWIKQKITDLKDHEV